MGDGSLWYYLKERSLDLWLFSVPFRGVKLQKRKWGQFFVNNILYIHNFLFHMLTSTSCSFSYEWVCCESTNKDIKGKSIFDHGRKWDCLSRFCFYIQIIGHLILNVFSFSLVGPLDKRKWVEVLTSEFNGFFGMMARTWYFWSMG